ncbi:LCP family protein [Lapillicoccus jejuensis]|uniref:LytR family transcriptional attenuator n=1 Tax=Lapillicoccus jejuensis TaxID=402171 RepID=A0A542DYE7_9MICO|nr:LCP family protein [Lapillicoccus jejuensis]TQJ08079.1 LytR family transcriptional attenuator [Lapillicoccus jejuensis]
MQVTPEHRDDTVGARTRRLQDRRRRSRRSLGLTVLALVPGAGLLPTRYRALGWTLLGLLLAALAVLGVLVATRGPRALVSSVLRVVVDPTLLLVLAAALVVGGLLWVGSIVLTHRATRPADADPAARWGLRLATLLCALLVALPVAQSVRYVGITRDTVQAVAGTSSLQPKVASTAKPAAQKEDPWASVPRVNMLLIGSDAGTDRSGLRTDSMVIASIDTKTGSTVLVSIPRNLERVPFPADNPLHRYFPDGYYCPQRGVGNECLINAVWEEALGHKDEFAGDRNPGLTTLQGVLTEITGLKIDDTTIIDLDGFEQLVDAMGGVYVNNTEKLPINGYHLSNGGVAGIEGYIEPGYQKLNGKQALWFARSRLLSDDYSRMRRQRCLIGAIVDQVDPGTMLTRYPQLAKVAQNNVETDVAVGDLPAWVDLVERIQKGGIRSLVFTYDVVNVARPNFTKMKAEVAAALVPPKAPATPTGPSTPSTPSPSTTTPSTPTAPPTTRAPDTSAAVDLKQAC